MATQYNQTKATYAESLKMVSQALKFLGGAPEQKPQQTNRKSRRAISLIQNHCTQQQHLYTTDRFQEYTAAPSKKQLIQKFRARRTQSQLKKRVIPAQLSEDINSQIDLRSPQPQSSQISVGQIQPQRQHSANHTYSSCQSPSPLKLLNAADRQQPAQQHQIIRKRIIQPRPIIVNNIILNNSVISNSTVTIKNPKNELVILPPQQQEKSQLETPEPLTKPDQKKLTLSMFKMEKLIGQGHFGQVYLARFLDSTIAGQLTEDKQYALKVVQLDRNIKSKQIDHLQGEKKALQIMQGCELFPELNATFVSANFACFVMTLVDGVSLHAYQREQISVPIDIVRYVSAVALQMLHKLHSESVIFRDLKPENIMINRATGMLTLVDFGFAKLISQHGRTFTKCGTPGYSAPEVLQQADTSDNTDDSYQVKLRQQTSFGYSYPSDVWSWGVLVCELVGGYNPFSHESKSVMETFTNILQGRVSWPKNMPQSLQLVLRRVFERDQQQRITITEIKKQSFYEGTQWDHLEKTFERQMAEVKTICDKIMDKKSENISSVPNFQSGSKAKSSCILRLLSDF